VLSVTKERAEEELAIEGREKVFFIPQFHFIHSFWQERRPRTKFFA
jgi:hypothetical protein